MRTAKAARRCSPWAVYQTRELDGVALSADPAVIAELLQEIQGDSQVSKRLVLFPSRYHPALFCAYEPD